MPGPLKPQKQKQDHLRMNVAPDRKIILGLQIVLDHRSLSSIGQRISMMMPSQLNDGVSISKDMMSALFISCCWKLTL